MRFIFITIIVTLSVLNYKCLIIISEKEKMKYQLGRNSAHPNCPVLVSPVRLSGPRRHPHQHPVPRRGRPGIIPSVAGGSAVEPRWVRRRHVRSGGSLLHLCNCKPKVQLYKGTSILLLIMLLARIPQYLFLKAKTELCTPSLDYSDTTSSFLVFRKPKSSGSQTPKRVSSSLKIAKSSNKQGLKPSWRLDTGI